MSTLLTRVHTCQDVIQALKPLLTFEGFSSECIGGEVVDFRVHSFDPVRYDVKSSCGFFTVLPFSLLQHAHTVRQSIDCNAYNTFAFLLTHIKTNKPKVGYVHCFFHCLAIVSYLFKNVSRLEAS